MPDILTSSNISHGQGIRLRKKSGASSCLAPLLSQPLETPRPKRGERGMSFGQAKGRKRYGFDRDVVVGHYLCFGFDSFIGQKVWDFQRQAEDQLPALCRRLFPKEWYFRSQPQTCGRTCKTIQWQCVVWFDLWLVNVWCEIHVLCWIRDEILQARVMCDVCNFSKKMLWHCTWWILPRYYLRRKRSLFLE